MKWQEKLAVLKMAGCKLIQTPDWITDPDDYFRFYVEGGGCYGTGDTKAKAVNDAWDEYMWELEQNEKAS